MSSYPYFAWVAPDDLPGDYYRRLLGGRTLPVVVVEGGWLSTTVGSIVTSEAKQARYISRQAQLLADLDAVALIPLTFPDIDLPAFPADLGAPRPRCDPGARKRFFRTQTRTCRLG